MLSLTCNTKVPDIYIQLWPAKQFHLDAVDPSPFQTNSVIYSSSTYGTFHNKLDDEQRSNRWSINRRTLYTHQTYTVCIAVTTVSDYLVFISAEQSGIPRQCRDENTLVSK